ncbi:MAG: chaperonin GroEL [Parcubacteria group bacterium Greene0714_7]|nr:MAG: chaperonin GroEL [Parcubacteria group bacterium Greene0714_7]
MAKKILFEADARNAVKTGIDIVARAVKVTLGPRGRNVILDKGYGGPHMTNDGVTIAKEITLKDKFQNMGAELVKEVASKTNDMAGDGTTTSVVLFQALVDEGMKHTAMGLNAMGIRTGMEHAAEAAVKALKSMAKPVAGDNKVIKQVATISAESEDIGKTIGEVIKEVGQNGVVTVEESQSFGIEKEVVEGMEFDRGYVSHYMITNPERMEAEYRDAPILVTDKKIASIQEILPVLEAIAKTGKKELVIIADDVEGEALTTFVVNKLRGAFSVLAVKAPGYGDRKKDMLADIASTIGATVVSEETGMTLDKVDISVLGRAQKVIATKDSTIIVGGKGKKSAIDARVASLKKQLEAITSKFDKEKIEERIAKLSGGVAVIRVGAATETEMKYLKDKIEDAVNATKAAIAEGIVPGGGTALVKAAAKAEADADWDGMSKEEEIGFRIVLSALLKPLKQIAMNAGKESGEVIVEAVKKAKGFAGYDAVKDEIVPDMMIAGIIDPVKVTRGGLEHAVSAAAILLTTEVAIADEPEEKKEMGGAPGGGMDY